MKIQLCGKQNDHLNLAVLKREYGRWSGKLENMASAELPEDWQWYEKEVSDIAEARRQRNLYEKMFGMELAIQDAESFKVIE